MSSKIAADFSKFAVLGSPCPKTHFPNLDVLPVSVRNETKPENSIKIGVSRGSRHAGALRGVSVRTSG